MLASQGVMDKQELRRWNAGERMSGVLVYSPSCILGSFLPAYVQ